MISQNTATKLVTSFKYLDPNTTILNKPEMYSTFLTYKS